MVVVSTVSGKVSEWQFVHEKYVLKKCSESVSRTFPRTDKNGSGLDWKWSIESADIIGQEVVPDNDRVAVCHTDSVVAVEFRRGRCFIE